MKVFTSNGLLLLAAAIWGLAFVAQRVGMEHVGPFTFNGVRFALGGLSLIPLILYDQKGSSPKKTVKEMRDVAKAGLLVGAVLFIAATLQQIGLVYTTAGKAAFITCLYMVVVPILGIFLKQYVSVSTWLGSAVAVAGLYLLCVKDHFFISYGETLELIGTFFWASHILLIDHFSRRVPVLQLAFFQFITCSVLSLVTAIALETIRMDSIYQAGIPILYGGVLSVGVAFTLQVIAQKNAQPSHAAIILSMETVFAAVGGWLILNESLGSQEVWGCIVMFAGMLLSQLQNLTEKRPQEILEQEKKLL